MEFSSLSRVALLIVCYSSLSFGHWPVLWNSVRPYYYDYAYTHPYVSVGTGWGWPYYYRTSDVGTADTAPTDRPDPLPLLWQAQPEDCKVWLRTVNYCEFYVIPENEPTIVHPKEESLFIETCDLCRGRDSKWWEVEGPHKDLLGSIPSGNWRDIPIDKWNPLEGDLGYFMHVTQVSCNGHASPSYCMSRRLCDNAFMCYKQPSVLQCLKPMFVCDNEPDCMGGADEFGCPTEEPKSAEDIAEETCATDVTKQWCRTTHKCIPMDAMCETVDMTPRMGNPNFFNPTAETFNPTAQNNYLGREVVNNIRYPNKPMIQTPTAHNYVMQERELRLVNAFGNPLHCYQMNGFVCQVSGECIPNEWKCNKYVDCADFSDEDWRQCSPYSQREVYPPVPHISVPVVPEQPLADVNEVDDEFIYHPMSAEYFIDKLKDVLQGLEDTATVTTPPKEETDLVYILDRKTHSDASRHCNRLGGYLMRPKTHDQHIQLITKVDGDKDAWVGLADTASEGQFVWSDDTVLDSDLYWCADEPNNRAYGTVRKGADCVVFDVAGNCLSDDHCRRRRAYVCEVPRTTNRDPRTSVPIGNEREEGRQQVQGSTLSGTPQRISMSPSEMNLYHSYSDYWSCARIQGFWCDKSHQCIPGNYVCDKIVDCLDFSDSDPDRCYREFYGRRY